MDAKANTTIVWHLSSRSCERRCVNDLRSVRRQMSGGFPERDMGARAAQAFVASERWTGATGAGSGISQAIAELFAAAGAAVVVSDFHEVPACGGFLHQPRGYP
jgi:hypothetical protein